MKVSYKKLWNLLIDRDMSRTELRLRAGISSVSLAKLGKNEGVTTNVLVKICSALDCNIGDIMDVVPERGKYEKNNPSARVSDIRRLVCSAIFCARTSDNKNYEHIRL